MASDASAPAWFAGKTIDDLRAIEHGGRVLIPEALVTLDPRGVERREEILVRVPNDMERAQARVDAIALVRRLARDGSPDAKVLTVDDARAAVGADVFENIDTAALLVRAIHEAKEPHGRAYLLDIFLTSWPASTWMALYDRLDFYARLYAPRFASLTEAEFWGMTREIARVRNLSPFAVIDGYAQNEYVVRLAEVAWSSRTPRSPSASPETSTPAS